ncbi:MAG: hypothetical protein IJT94_12010 [Oscillibacter sp.]|nr:hypothetical protein [Oscillibacter sp.]
MSSNTIQVIDRGLKCLSEGLGGRETEIFISTLLREGFDYTEWRRNMVNSIITHEDMAEFVERAGEKAQFHGKSAVIL